MKLTYPSGNLRGKHKQEEEENKSASLTPQWFNSTQIVEPVAVSTLSYLKQSKLLLILRLSKLLL